MPDKKPPVLEYAKSPEPTARYDLIEAIAAPFTHGFTVGFSLVVITSACVFGRALESPMGLVVVPIIGWLLGKFCSTSVLIALWILGYPPRTIHKGRPTKGLTLSTGFVFGVALFGLPGSVNLLPEQYYPDERNGLLILCGVFIAGIVASAICLRPAK